MVEPAVIALVILGAYLFGSISLARLITSRIGPGTSLEDVTVPDLAGTGTRGLRTVGATTASIAYGPRVGGLIGILDILKGLLPTLVLRLLFPGSSLYLYAGMAIVAGHIWPAYYRFRGGGGLSPALGVMLVMDAPGILVCVVLAFLLGMFVVREIAVALMGGPWLFLIWIALRTGNWEYAVTALVLNLFMTLAVIPDIRAHLRSKKAGDADLAMSMETIPMGRMMMRMMDRLGVPARGKTRS